MELHFIEDGKIYKNTIKEPTLLCNHSLCDPAHSARGRDREILRLRHFSEYKVAVASHLSATAAATSGEASSGEGFAG
jgi:hypothetical protein